MCNEAVFKSVFDSYFKLLRNFLIYRYKNIERAEDTAQNAFVILWESRIAVVYKKLLACSGFRILQFSQRITKAIRESD